MSAETILRNKRKGGLYSILRPIYWNTRKNLIKSVLIYRQKASNIRMLPNFIIVGAMKSGTSALYRYLTSHPLIYESFRKEVSYFDVNYKKSINWYKAHFNICKDDSYITGEASPYYIFHPHAAKRIKRDLPSVKLIFILRNPVKRAYSHYWHNVRTKLEVLPFDKAIAMEEERIQEATYLMVEDESYFDNRHKLYSYLARGRYIEQIKRWVMLFPRDRMLFINSEDLERNTTKVLNQVFTFLDIFHDNNLDTRRFYVNKYQPIPKKMEAFLTEYYKKYNEELSFFLNRDLLWN